MELPQGHYAGIHNSVIMLQQSIFASICSGLITFVIAVIIGCEVIMGLEVLSKAKLCNGRTQKLTVMVVTCSNRCTLFHCGIHLSHLSSRVFVTSLEAIKTCYHLHQCLSVMFLECIYSLFRDTSFDYAVTIA